ncbi:hypothetical protein ScPMuIL_014894 [Solemya velum]
MKCRTDNTLTSTTAATVTKFDRDTDRGKKVERQLLDSDNCALGYKESSSNCRQFCLRNAVLPSSYYDDGLNRVPPVDRPFHSPVTGRENQTIISLKEMLNHNEAVRWREWFKYGQKVYSVTSLKKLLLAQLQQRLAETSDGEKSSDNDKEEDEDGDDDDDAYGSNDGGEEYVGPNGEKCFRSEADIDNTILWRGNPVVSLLSYGIDREEIKNNLSLCCVGNLPGPATDQYWQDVRSEILNIKEDLERNNAVCQSGHELLEVCYRWLKMYSYTNPPIKSHIYFRGDPNRNPFQLPEDVQRNPNSLRDWVETWTQFNTVVPESGAWEMKEVEDIDMGDPDETFKDSLRTPTRRGVSFITEVQGEAGWEVLPECVIEQDIPTEGQKRILQSREKRKNLYNEKHMKVRREKLADYFIKKYGFEPKLLENYLLFAERMRTNSEEFEGLCRE